MSVEEIRLGGGLWTGMGADIFFSGLVLTANISLLADDFLIMVAVFITVVFRLYFLSISDIALDTVYDWSSTVSYIGDIVE